MNRNRLIAAALVFPIAVMLLWLVQLEAAYSSGEIVTLRVRAYDPRDLLAGHYLTYAVDYGMRPCDGRWAKETCVCLNDEKPASAGWAGDCAEKPSGCTKWLRGVCKSGFEAGLERFYFPEVHASKLSRVPPDSTIEAVLDGKGNGRVTGFFAGGVPLLEYLRRE